MFLSWLMLLVALSLSVIAAFYSIAGLAAIFAAAVIPIIIMGGILEIAKLTVTVWLHEYWDRCRLLMKVYLVPAVVLLAFITSMGIFGFLSKAHSDQGMVSGDVQAKIAIYDEKIKTERENIDANRKALKQLDEAVDQVMARSTDEKGADKAVAIRRSQQKDRARLLEEIAKSQSRIAALNEERAPIAAEVRKVEAEVGPIKYIAALVYGDNPDANILERAVRWVIIILVIVFDPLAIMMLLAATESFKWEKQLRNSSADPAYEQDDGPLSEEQIEQIQESAEKPAEEDTRPWYERYPYLNKPFVHFNSTKPLTQPAEVTPVPDEVIAAYNDERLVSKFDKEVHELDDQEYETAEEKEAKRIWKSQHPGSTVKAQREKLARGDIDQLPWVGLMADNEFPRGTTTGFGISFPESPNKGDSFVRVDIMPNRVYKFNGNDWIVVDKNLNDNYTYDTAYIDHLIEKIASGEYDPELLNDNERDQVAARINQTKA
jgi:hypothetical protein